MEIRRLDGTNWYRRGQYWYKTPSGSATAHELRRCDNPSCRREFFASRNKNRLGKQPVLRFCSRGCFVAGFRDERNPAWRGTEVGYRAGHLRVRRERGAATECTIPDCASGSRTFQWASLTGNWADSSDYRAMCVFHHRAYDWALILGMEVGEALQRVEAIPPEAQRMASLEHGHALRRRRASV